MPERDWSARDLEAMRLVIVEDDPDSLMLLSLMARRAGHVVTVAASNAGAISGIDWSQVDACMSDWNLADGVCAELMTWLREFHPSVRAAIFTSGPIGKPESQMEHLAIPVFSKFDLSDAFKQVGAKQRSTHGVL